MKNILLVLAVIVISVGCGENKSDGKLTSFDACSCAKVQDMNSEDYKKCSELRNDQKFNADYQKCKMAFASGITDTSKITIQNTAEATNLLPAKSGSYNVDIASSNVRWYAQKVTRKKHSGTINVKSGSLNIADGKIVSGEIILDMTSITNVDQSGEGKTKLENHLKSADFFDVAKFSEAVYTITSANAKTAYDYEVKGNLTIKGITKEVPCTLVIAPNGEDVNIGGGFTFDRSLFDVRYGSDTFFDNLGNDMIENNVTVVVDMKAKKG